MRRSPKPAPPRRAWSATIDATFDETAMERLLADAVRRGVVTQYDTGRGSFCWFNGPPGEGLRAVRRAAQEIAGRREPK